MCKWDNIFVTQNICVIGIKIILLSNLIGKVFEGYEYK